MNRRSWLFVVGAAAIALAGLAYGISHGVIGVGTFKIHIPIG